MDADLELNPDGTVVSTPGHGGRRAGAGGKKGFSRKKAEEMAAAEDAEAGESDSTSLFVRKSRAIAMKEEALAQQAWLKYRIDSGEYLSRSAFREAAATLLAELAQGLRSLPDTLERKHNLPANVVQAIEADIDEALSRVADGMELFTGAPE